MNSKPPINSTARAPRVPRNPSAPPGRLPPGPTEPPVVGQAFHYHWNPIPLMEKAAGYGDLVTMSVKPWLVYLVNHPDLIQEVLIANHTRVGRWRNVEAMKFLMGEGLVTSDDPLHLRQRRLMQPAFHQQQIQTYSAIMIEYAQRHSVAWRDGNLVDMASEMRDLTLNIVARTLFGIDLLDEVRRIGKAFELSNTYMSTRFNQYERMRSLYHRLPLPLTVRFRRQLNYLNRVVQTLIEQRKGSQTNHDDLLSVLLQLSDDDLADPSGAGMTDEQVRDEIVTMFAVGHETVTVALTWTWYLLSTHPAIQDNFQFELDSVLGDRPPTLEDLPNLVFTDQVFREAMRLYPPIWRLGRVAMAPFELGGYEIPAGAMLCLPTFITQRDARWFDDPNDFRPERWTTDFKDSLHRFAYYPFGGGPRLCIGEGFAWMEAKLILATLGQLWTVRHDARHKVGFIPLISLRPNNGMPLFLSQRRPAQ